MKHKSYPIPYKMQNDIDKEIDDMLAIGVIERSEGPYASPLVLVKKPDNTYRECINFKVLNKITVFDIYYSTFDFSEGYLAIPIRHSSRLVVW